MTVAYDRNATLECRDCTQFNRLQEIFVAEFVCNITKVKKYNQLVLLLVSEGYHAKDPAARFDA